MTHPTPVQDVLQNRLHGAQLLSELLARFKHTDAVIVAIPMGGIPIGYYIAKRLELPLEISFCKKLTHPAGDVHPIGSVSDDYIVLNQQDMHEIPGDFIYHRINAIQHALRMKDNTLRSDGPLQLTGKTVILVDDRLKTVETMLASIKSIQKKEPSSIIIAVPVASRRAANQIMNEVDEVVCPIILNDEKSVSECYRELPRVTEEEARQLVMQAMTKPGSNLQKPGSCDQNLPGH